MLGTRYRPDAVFAGAATSFWVIALAELGGLSDIMIANLASRYHDPVVVATGGMLALSR